MRGWAAHRHLSGLGRASESTRTLSCAARFATACAVTLMLSARYNAARLGPCADCGTRVAVAMFRRRSAASVAQPLLRHSASFGRNGSLRDPCQMLTRCAATGLARVCSGKVGEMPLHEGQNAQVSPRARFHMRHGAHVCTRAHSRNRDARCTFRAKRYVNLTVSFCYG